MPEGLPGAPAQVAAALGRGVVGYWRFDETAGSTVARDRSGLGNDCTLHDPKGAAPAWTDGVVGGALNLDGRGWVSCNQVQSWAALSNELTIATWVKRSAGHPGLRAIVSRQKGMDSADYFLFGLSGDVLVFASSAWNTRIKDRIGGYDRWTHLAVTRAADGTVVLYVDGAELRREQRPSAGSITGGPNALVIGGGVNVPDPDRPTELFDGALDELVIYGRALAGDEIAALASGAEPKI